MQAQVSVCFFGDTSTDKLRRARLRASRVNIVCFSETNAVKPRKARLHRSRVQIFLGVAPQQGVTAYVYYLWALIECEDARKHFVGRDFSFSEVVFLFFGCKNRT